MLTRASDRFQSLWHDYALLAAPGNATAGTNIKLYLQRNSFSQ